MNDLDARLRYAEATVAQARRELDALTAAYADVTLAVRALLTDLALVDGLSPELVADVAEVVVTLRAVFDQQAALARALEP